MTNIIENWLQNCVRVKLSVDADQLGDAFFDGTLFAQILLKYGVCSAKYAKSIYKTPSYCGAFCNLKKLRVFFKLLDISCTDEFLKEIARKNSRSALRLLYELFVHLESRENTQILDEKIETKTEVDEKNYNLETNLRLWTTNQSQASIYDFLENEPSYLQKCMHECAARRTAIKKFLNKIEPVRLNINFTKSGTEKYINVGEVDRQGNCDEQNVDANKEGDARAFISQFKIKRRQENANLFVNKKIELENFKDSWKQVLLAKEKEIRDILAKKLFMQSEYEKQMASSIKRSRLRYLKFFKKKRVLEEIDHIYENIDDSPGSIKVVLDQKPEDAYKAEQAKIKILHRRLYHQRKRMKHQNIYATCYRILSGILDFALMQISYKEEFKIHPPQKTLDEWKRMFLKGIPILEKRNKDRLKVDDTIPLQANFDENEVETEFQNYVLLKNQWDPEKLSIPAKKQERLNVVGYIVHRILDMKYLLNTTVKASVNMPHYDLQVLIRPVLSKFIIHRIKDCMKEYKVIVFEPCLATRYVITSFRKSLYGERHRKKGTPNFILHKRPSPSHFKITKSDSPEIRSTTREKSQKTIEIKSKTIGIQAPSAHLLHNGDKRPAIPKPILLGMVVTDCIKNKIKLPRILTSLAIIEFIRSFDDIAGWVLINFPRDMLDVGILEYLYSGIEAPFLRDNAYSFWLGLRNRLDLINEKLTVLSGVYHDENHLNMNNDNPDLVIQNMCSLFMDPITKPKQNIEETVKLNMPINKRSRILPKPNPDEPLDLFQSIFDKVIRFPIECSTGFPSESHDAEESNLLTTTQEVDDFYEGLGISKMFVHESFTLDALMSLGNVIIDQSEIEGSIHLSEAMDLFEFDILKKTGESHYARDVLKDGNEFREKVTRKSKLSCNENSSQIKFKITGLDYDDISDETDVYPGHTHWNFTKPEIKQNYVHQLATVWETLEYVYSDNVVRAFSSLKELNLQLSPYAEFIFKKSQKCIKLTDFRIELVLTFQKLFNSVIDNTRSLESARKILKCRAFDLQSNLWKLTDIKKMVSEEVLDRLKIENSLEKHLSSYLRNYFCLLQAEMDRYVDTMQLITDYHCIAVKKEPSKKRINKISLPKFEWDQTSQESGRKGCGLPSFFSSPSERFSKSIASAFKTVSAGLLIPRILYIRSVQDALEIISKIKKVLKLQVNEVRNICNKICEESRVMILSLGISAFSRKAGASHISILTEKRNLTEHDKLMLEWDFALEEETDRILLRIDLIQSNAKKTMEEVISVVQMAFKNFHKDIIHQYHSEISSIDKLCVYIRKHISQALKLDRPISIEDNKFIISQLDNDSVIVSPPPTPIDNVKVGFKFTTQQLLNFVAKMTYVAPIGIPKKAFVYILEDMADMGHVLGHPYLPPVWSSMEAENIKFCIKGWFGRKSVISWKEFVVHALDLSYPTIQELLRAKTEFEKNDPQSCEVITEKQFMNTKLWFENDAIVSNRINIRNSRAKEILFQLFGAGCGMNYTCFLLAFCRDECPVDGLFKALATVEGSLTVSSRRDMFREELQVSKHEEKFIIVKQTLDLIMNNVFFTDVVKIWEFFDEEEGEYDDFLPDWINWDISLQKTSTSTVNDQDLTSLQHGGETICHELGKKSPTCVEKQTEPERSPEFTMSSLLWKSDVQYNTIISLLTFYLNYFAHHPDNNINNLEIIHKVKKVFLEKGNGHTIQLYKLLEDYNIIKILSAYRLFQPISLSRYMSMFNNMKHML